jgi:hypothetical protein
MSGGGHSKQQQATNNQVAQQQLAIEKGIIQQYQNQFLAPLQAGGGYLPGVKQALTSEAIQSVPQNYAGASQQLLSTLGSRGAAGGGSQPGSGLLGAGLGQLYASEANQRSNLLNQITAQGQQNLMAGYGGLLGAGQTAGGVGSSALGSATTAAGNADQASASLWGGIIGGGLGVLGDVLVPGGVLNKK